MAFLRVVEVFPPLFPIKGGRSNIDLDRSLRGLVEQVSVMRSYADLILVASVKNPSLLKVSSVRAASLIQERTGQEAAPSIVVRDSNRLQILSEVVSAFSLGLKSLMLVWGDRYPPEANSRNSYDFQSLADVISEAERIGTRVGVDAMIFAPLTVTSRQKAAARLGKGRLKAGASFLLGQPPTTDAFETFDAHATFLEAAELKNSTLLNVFPFRDRKDVLDCEKYFGWTLPKRLHEKAKGGREALLDEARGVVERLRSEGFPGVYVSTRGDPELAKGILG